VWAGIELVAIGLVLPVFWFPLRWLPLTLVALPVIPLVLVARWRTVGRLTPASATEWPLLMVLGATCLAEIPVFDASLAAPKILGLALGAAALLAIQSAVTSRAAVDRAVVGLAVLTLGLAVLGLVGVEWPTSGKLAVLDPLLRQLPVLVRGIVPNTATGAINPNELAGNLALLVPLVAARFVSRGASRLPRSRAAALGGAIAVGGLLLVAMQSRGALVGASLGLILLLTLERQMTSGLNRRAALAALCLALVLGLAAAWGGLTTLRYAQADSPASPTSLDSLTGRLELWGRSVAMLRDFAVTGIGPGQFNPVLHMLYPTDLVAADQFVPHAHNLYLAYAVELGIPGALAVTVLVIVVVRGCVTAARGADPVLRSGGLGVISGLAAFFVFGITDAIAPGARGGLPFWMVLGLGTAVGRLAGRVTPSR
jgi:O-Antigen ligase